MFSSKVFTLTLIILIVSCMVESKSTNGNLERVKRGGCANGGIPPYCCANRSRSPYCCANGSPSPYCCANHSMRPDCS
ncbi:unnamed protein product [Chironomus riparius]|uniref:Uncharacterized protein n=1 Tax=Chironomus riparius TaxID=315576 RepID=A0A9N9RKR9_9DIPT|nr:unnamed protein product [Chironomus riparius]